MSTDLAIIGLSGETIAKRRTLYESAKRNNVERVASPDEALKYLEVIEFQSERLEKLEDEIKEIRSKGEKQLVETLASLNETLKLLKQYVEKK